MDFKALILGGGSAVSIAIGMETSRKGEPIKAVGWMVLAFILLYLSTMRRTNKKRKEDNNGTERPV